MTDFIYKICSRAAFDEAKASGALAPSADDVRDGYIHLSSRAQVRGTLERHFRDQRDLILLTVSVERLAPGALRWEPSRDGQRFPHLYGSLPVSAVERVLELSDDEASRTPLDF